MALFCIKKVVLNLSKILIFWLRTGFGLGKIGFVWVRFGFVFIFWLNHEFTTALTLLVLDTALIGTNFLDRINRINRIINRAKRGMRVKTAFKQIRYHAKLKIII